MICKNYVLINLIEETLSQNFVNLGLKISDQKYEKFIGDANQHFNVKSNQP